MGDLDEIQVYFKLIGSKGNARYASLEKIKMQNDKSPEKKYTLFIANMNDFYTKDGILQIYNSATDFEYDESIQKKYNLYSNIVTGFKVNANEESFEEENYDF